MANSLNPEDITVVQSAGESTSAHDNSRGYGDDNDSDDSGGHDLFINSINHSGIVDDHD